MNKSSQGNTIQGDDNEMSMREKGQELAEGWLFIGPSLLPHMSSIQANRMESRVITHGSQQKLWNNN